MHALTARTAGPIRKILVIKLRSLGDTVLMTAPLEELRLAFPAAQIHVLVTQAWADLLSNLPSIDRLWKYEKPPGKAARARGLARLALSLRKERFDCVVNLHASPSTAFLSFATGAKARSIHFHGHRDRNRFSTVKVPGKGVLKPVIERDMDAVRALGLSIPEGKLPAVLPTDREKTEAADFLKTLGLEKPFMIIGLGASRPTKSWPVERFAQVAVAWVRKNQGGVIAVGAPNEEELIHSFLKKVDDELLSAFSDSKDRAAIRNRISGQNRIPLRNLAAMMSQASVFLGNDSGPKHLAVASQCPTVTVFGPEHPMEWHPYPADKNPYFFIENLSCRQTGLPGYPPWCGLDVCTVEEHKCMRMIGTDAVMAACEKVAGK